MPPMPPFDVTEHCRYTRCRTHGCDGNCDDSGEVPVGYSTEAMRAYAAQCVRVELEEAVKELAHWKQWAAADLVRSMINEGNDNG